MYQPKDAAKKYVIPSSPNLVTLMMEAIRSFEKSVTTIATLRYITEDGITVSSYGSHSQLADSCHPDDGGDTFLRSVGSYKSHAA
jgi:hypothetical protein